MFDLRRLRKLPHQRMFASPRADDEKLHLCRGSEGSSGWLNGDLVSRWGKPLT